MISSLNLVVNDFLCRDGVTTGSENLYGLDIDDSGCLHGPGLVFGFRGDRIILELWVGSFIVNALKQKSSVSAEGAGRVKSIGPVRMGMQGGVVSMMCIAVLRVVEHCLWGS